ncbi:MAG: glycosyltransferase family 2 protein [Candidatus Binatia bacterium]
MSHGIPPCARLVAAPVTLPAVTAVVLNWHGRADTLACLQALAAQAYPNCSLVLVDNGCADFTAAEVAAQVAGAQYLRTDTNLGFAGGANLGMRHALHAGADYVWFLNNDARPGSDALRELVAVAAREPAIGIAGAKILQSQAPHRLDSIALDVNLRTGRLYLRGHDEIDAGQYDHVTRVQAVSGCAMLVRRAACERLQGFDDAFFAYLEDADLCMRAHAAGFQVIAVPRAQVFHNRAVAMGRRQSRSSLYYTARNHLLLMQRYGQGAGLLRGLRVMSVVALNMAYAIRGEPGERSARLRAVFSGIRDYHRGVVGAGVFAEH